MTEDAKTKGTEWQECERCGGLGDVSPGTPDERECPQCEGRGIVPVEVWTTSR